MRKTNKRSEGYKTRAQLKKEKKEQKKLAKMEKKFLIGLYDDYRKDGLLNHLLNKIACKLIGTYSTEPIYNMYSLENDDTCVVETNGNNSIKIEVWEVNEIALDKIEKSYSYYSEFEEYPQDYIKQEVLSPFGNISIYFTNVAQDKNKLILSGDWIEYLNYKKAIGNKKLTI